MCSSDLEVSGLHRRVRYQAFIRLSTRGGTTDGEQSAPILTTAAPEVPVTGHLTASGPDQLTATVDDVAGRDWDKVRVILWSDGIYLEEAQVLPGQSVTFTRFAGFADQSGYRALFNTSMTGIANTPAGDKRAVKGQDSPERIYAFGTPKLMDVRLSGYAGDQSWNIDHGWVDANGTSEGACRTEPDRPQHGLQPNSTRNRTDLDTSFDRSRRGTGPISRRSTTRPVTSKIGRASCRERV